MKQNKKHNVVAVILARGGSKGLPRKNILPLLGKPLIQYTIDPLKQVKEIDRIIVSTDDKEIAEVSRNLGAEIPFLRPKEFSQDFTTTEESLKHAINWLKENEGYHTDILVFLQITDLFKDPQLIRNAVLMLLEDDGLDSVFVASPTHKHYWIKDAAGYRRLTENAYGPRQLRPPVYREDTGLGCATRAHIVTGQGKRLGEKVKIIENPDFVIDIHSEFDLWLTDKLLKERPEFKKYLI